MADDRGLAFVIDGREYPSPELDSLTMGERRVMYDLSGIVQEDFAPREDETEDEHDARVTRQIRHPGFMESLMTIAYQRGNPDVKRDKVAAIIGNTNYLDAIEKWSETAEEADSRPLELTPSPDAPSSSETNGHNSSSGDSSRNATDEPDVTPAPTGTMRSATSRTSVPVRSMT